LSPVNPVIGKADEVYNSEGTIATLANGQKAAAFPGSENTARCQSGWVNVGGPDGSARTVVPVNKRNSEATGTAVRKSEGA
jgi:hypothetical protein